MNSRGVQTITVNLNGADRMFDERRPVTIGRAPDVGLFVDSPLVSRVHAILSWQGAWVFADQGSTNGVFVNGQRVDRPFRVDVPTLVRLGDPHTGPALTLTPRAPQTAPVPMAPQAPANVNQTMRASTDMLPPVRARQSTAPIAAAGRVPAEGLTIGRTRENNIVVNDVLASRNHARLFPASEGLTIEDLGSVNGTFVNGGRVQRQVLREGDIVTIGNIDFVVAQGNLQYRKRAAAAAGLGIHGLGFTVEGNKQLLVDVNMSAGHGSLTAMIGPSGAGKSTLAKIVAGNNSPSIGAVTFEGRNLHAEYESLRSRIGMVPQDDVLHRQLTIKQALGYAAELRLPPDTTKADRERVIEGVLSELSLTEHKDKRIDKLSGGQRKRASVALELLTGPTLLILDEPTSGLDPALDRQVMVMLRQLADAGRVVIVVTHSLTHLDMCDQVLLLAPGGKTAYCGHPAGIGDAMGTKDWAEIFSKVASSPDEVFAAYRATQPQRPAPPQPRMGPPGRPAHTSTSRQISTIARRQIALILADKGYLAFLVALPFILGLLTFVVPGEAGFSAPALNEKGQPSNEPSQILVLLFLGACFMGLTLSVRDLVGERTIYYRERAVGLLPSAYLVAKIAIFSLFAVLQSIVLVVVAAVGKDGPPEGALLPGSVEMFVDVAFTACCCVLFGLALSAIAKSNEQVMPLLVVTIMLQLVMCGGLIPVTGRAGLDQISWLFPARWGYAAGASTVDLRTLFPLAQEDILWKHEPGIWLLDLMALVILGVVVAIFTFTRVRAKARTS